MNNLKIMFHSCQECNKSQKCYKSQKIIKKKQRNNMLILRYKLTLNVLHLYDPYLCLEVYRNLNLLHLLKVE